MNTYTLVQKKKQFLGSNALMQKEERDKMMHMCYPKDYSIHHAKHNSHRAKHGHHASSSKNTTGGVGVGVFANRHHNGLGNQLFQYIFSRLTAESLGAYM
jgi:hypothetical protein